MGSFWAEQAWRKGDIRLNVEHQATVQSPVCLDERGCESRIFHKKSWGCLWAQK